MLARYDLTTTGRRPRGGLWSYRDLLPVTGPPVSLGEPETPLLPLPRLSARLGVDVAVVVYNTASGPKYAC